MNDEEREVHVSDEQRAQQEGVLRQVNEGIERGVWPGDDGDLVRMRCECGRGNCNDYIAIRVAEYERTRANPRRFLLCDGHQTDRIETVVEHHPRYIVVEKTLQAAAEAAKADPEVVRERSDLRGISDGTTGR